MELENHFTIKSGEMRVSDPCYSQDSPGGFVLRVPNGTWHAAITLDRGDVTELVVYHESLVADVGGRTLHVHPTEKSDFQVDVDSGQAGFYDEKCYPEIPNERYEEMCALTNPAGVFDCGVVSSSGVGDGTYDLFLQRDEDGLVVAARIVFIEEDQDDFEDEDYEDEEDENDSDEEDE